VVRALSIRGQILPLVATSARWTCHTNLIDPGKSQLGTNNRTRRNQRAHAKHIAREGHEFLSPIIFFVLRVFLFQLRLPR
jgi:hypothetical protein